MKTTLILLSVLAGLLVFDNPRGAAQPPLSRRPVVVRRHDHRPGPKRISRLPTGFVRIVFDSREFFYREGIFYRHTREGYVAITGPVGVRMKSIPVMAVKVRIGPATFHYYHGTYYRYDPRERVYIVVSPERESIRDVVVLSDGQILTGRYLSGDSRSIDFQSGTEILEIPVRDIVSITFSSREYDDNAE